MAVLVANTTCRNPHCPNGKNGTPKRYYACAYCRDTESWRAVACCPECYAEYIRLVRIGRGELRPERPRRVAAKKVKEESMAEMERFLGYVPATIEDGVDAVNSKLDSEGWSE